MPKFQFQKAVKSQEKLRLALDGPAGAGKTWTALTVATVLAGAEHGSVAVIDSERSSARKYAGDFDFDHLTLPDVDPVTYRDAVLSAIDGGYAAIIVDSLSHAWEGTLDLKDRVQKRSTNKDGFGAWREVTPIHNELVDTILRAPAHVIVTMRTKTEYSVEKDENGKTKITRLGLKPQQREGVEYEFDVVGDMDIEHNLIVSKSRCSALADAVIHRPGEMLARTLLAWLGEGEPVVSAEQAETLTGALNAISDEQDRRRTKAQFKASFGLPADVLASRFADALAFVANVMVPAEADAEFEAFSAGPFDAGDETAVDLHATGRQPESIEVSDGVVLQRFGEPDAAASGEIMTEPVTAACLRCRQEPAASPAKAFCAKCEAEIEAEEAAEKPAASAVVELDESAKRMRHLQALVTKAGLGDVRGNKNKRLKFASQTCGREIDSFAGLTPIEVDALVRVLEERLGLKAPLVDNEELASA